MEKHKTLSLLVISIVIFFSNLLCAGSGPMFLLTPTTPTTLSVPVNGAASVIYNLTNKTKKKRMLAMKPITGVVQTTAGKGVCSSPVNLGAQQSCLLVLTIYGNQLAGNISGGPLVCQTAPNGVPGPFFCYYPSPQNSLKINLGAAENAHIELPYTQLETITMTAGSSVAGKVAIVNTSTILTATNIQATLPASWTDVIQHSNDCLSVLPGSTCFLSFTPGNAVHSSEIITIKGSNTSELTVTLSVAEPSSISVTPSPAIIDLNGSLVFTVTNNGTTSTGVNVTLPQSWTSGVIVTNPCHLVNAGATCEITITSTTPYVADLIGIQSTDGSPLIQIPVAFSDSSLDTPAPLVFSVNGPKAYFISAADNAISTPWIPIATTPDTTITDLSLTDGATNTGNIIAAYGTTAVYAASTCYNHGTGAGVWYLPAICELGGSGEGALCGYPPTLPIDNVDINLFQVGFLSSLLGNLYWSSTEITPGYAAWFQAFYINQSFQYTYFEDLAINVRCATTKTYV